jgi:hypothetical protein
MTEKRQSAGKNDFLIYLAGFLDADGCIGIHKQPSTGGKINLVPTVSLTSTCKMTVDFIHSRMTELDYGHHITFRKVSNPNWKDRYQLECRGMKRCQKILEDLVDYLVTKKQEAKDILEFIRLRQSHSKMIPYSEKELGYIEKVKLAKKNR